MRIQALIAQTTDSSGQLSNPTDSEYSQSRAQTPKPMDDWNTGVQQRFSSWSHQPPTIFCFRVIARITTMKWTWHLISAFHTSFRTPRFHIWSTSLGVRVHFSGLKPNTLLLFICIRCGQSTHILRLHLVTNDTQAFTDFYCNWIFVTSHLTYREVLGRNIFIILAIHQKSLI